MIDLTPQQLLLVKEIVRQYVPEYKVWAFGSRVNGTTKKYSDLDLALVGSGKVPTQHLFALRAAFAESSLPFEVDVVDWHRISKPFQRIIEQNFIEIQG